MKTESKTNKLEWGACDICGAENRGRVTKEGGILFGGLALSITCSECMNDWDALCRDSVFLVESELLNVEQESLIVCARGTGDPKVLAKKLSAIHHKGRALRNDALKASIEWRADRRAEHGISECGRFLETESEVISE